MIYIFNQDEELLTILSPEGPSPYKEAAHLEQLNGEHSFSFWVPANHEDSQFVKEENLVAFKDEDGDIRLFVIKELDDVHEDTLYKEAFCQAAWIDELNDEPIEDIRPQDKTASEVLTSILSGKRWQAGNVASLGLNSTNFYYESAVSVIKKILNLWGGEIKDRIVITDNKITGRFIDILARRGADTGKRFEITKDIQSLRRKVLSYPKTAMYGRGKGIESGDGFSRKITFADVVWSKANGDPVDKPAGQEWVGDSEALAQYGRKNMDGSKRHRFGFFESSDEEDPAKLLRSTWDDLQDKKKPIMRYEFKVIDMEGIPGFEHEKVRLGDTTFGIDRFFVPAILVESRIIEIKRYLNEPERTEIKLGNFIDNILDYNKKLEKIEATINDGKGVWDSGGGPIDDTDWPDTVPPTPTNIVADGLLRSITLKWNFEPSSYIAAYEVYGSQVQGFTADVSNLLFRGKSGGYVLAGDINQTWYFRMRAINTHGTASALSAEVSASTRSIVAEDITPLIITNEMIAMDAEIDFAKIANVLIINAMIANLAVSTGKIADLAVTEAKIANLAVTNAKIKDLHAEKITSGKIKTRFLDVTGIDNFVWNSDCSQEGGYTGNIQRPGPAGNQSVGAVSQSGRDGHGGDEFNVEPGEVFHVGGWAYTSNSNIEFRVGVKFWLNDGSFSWVPGAFFSQYTKNSWQFTEGTVKAPSNAIKGQAWYQINATSNFGTWYHTRTFVRRQGLITADRIVSGEIDGIDVIVRDELTLKQTDSTAGLFFRPTWSSGSSKKSSISVNYVSYDSKGETHGVVITPNIDNPKNGYVSVNGDFRSYDRENGRYNIFADPIDFTRRGKQIPYGNMGDTQVVYQAASQLGARVNINFPKAPYVNVTLQWVSGCVSTTLCETVYVENVSASGFDIKVRDNQGRFTSGSYIYVTWHAFCYDQTYT